MTYLYYQNLKLQKKNLQLYKLNYIEIGRVHGEINRIWAQYNVCTNCFIHNYQIQRNIFFISLFIFLIYKLNLSVDFTLHRYPG